MRALDRLLDRPAAVDAPPRARRDWVLTGVGVAAVGVEVLLRGDLQWPLVMAAVAVVAMVALPWRRSHPVTVVAVVTVPGTLVGLAQWGRGLEADALASAAIAIVVPYALFRWSSARQCLIGGALLTVGVAVSVISQRGGLADAIGGATVVTLVAVLGELARQRAAARSRDLEQARLLERERIARDLHDTVAHHLSAVAVRAQVGQLQSTEPAALEALRQTESEARRALDEIRTMTRLLRTGLSPSPGLEELAALADAGPPRVTVTVARDAAPLPPAVAAGLFRVAQEAVANARRHAVGASQITVELGRDVAHTHVLRVHDDGVGGDPDPPAGLGVPGMAERVAHLGGRLEAGPDPDGGWTVTARIPDGGR
ncbi:sensor histidine kinase [Nocardioides limicola]|uniref:sensor histidine kinase n=1 Tax=Nocardioides limicola TaxID=2803368 RepID=UPI00193BEF87|nr:histidine kinase [Nocardioides sp. DJM-14]